MDNSWYLQTYVLWKVQIKDLSMFFHTSTNTFDWGNHTSTLMIGGKLNAPRYLCGVLVGSLRLLKWKNPMYGVHTYVHGVSEI